MQAQKTIKKPNFSSASNKKVAESIQQKIKKVQLFYRYRLPSIYRELKAPIYDNLLAKQTNFKNTGKQSIKKTNTNPNQYNFEARLQILYKKVMLNSKYHHRQKMRFSRTPLLKYLKFDFRALQQKLKSKKYLTIYDDLQDDSQEDDNEKQDKKQFQRNQHFSAQALARYKKKNGINGNIVIAHGYDDIKQRLIDKYGWTQNPDTTSLMYDYKHMSKKSNIDYVNILDEQVVNHYHQNKSITAKFGLTRNIRNLCSINKDPSIFFPRCFDVNDVSELENFYESFKETFVDSILKKCVETKGAVPQGLTKLNYQNIINKCIQILKNRYLSIQEKVNRIEKRQQIFINDNQWKNFQKYSTTSLKYLSSSQLISQELLTKAKQLCQYGQKVDPQWNINKDNIWIVKPASLSRGRGIKTFNDINQIFEYIVGKQISWVVQKYIQNPLIIKKRKFDIRQWVLLTDFKPFRVWFYQQCYIRFCATVYEPENLKDRKVHLTNNSVTKGVSDIVNDGIHQNMISQKQFSQILGEKQGKLIFQSIIKPQMKKVAIQALQSVQQNMLSRKNTFQIFGFDFMIDENYRVWLIQVNSSPTMQYSTKVTTEVVQKGMSDLADLVNNYMMKGKYYDKARAKQLYGGWKLLTNNQ